MFATLGVLRYASKELPVCCLALALVVLLGVSCSDDDPCKPPPIQQDNYQDLTERDHVLVNLETAYKERNSGEIDKLLDDDFVFFFSNIDVGNGDTQRLWDKSGELAATKNIFDPNYTGQYRVLDIDVDFWYTEGDSGWTAVTPRDALKFPGETWYKKTAVYRIQIVAEAQPENITFIAVHVKAQFVIRQADVGGKRVWRVVECRDDVDAAAVTGTGVDLTSAVESFTWGRIKQLYYRGPDYLDISERDHVLENLELCYNERNFIEYARLLDDSHFIYFFSDEDFAQGRTPEQWGRIEDLYATIKMFDPNYEDGYRVVSMELGLLYPADQWITFIPDQGEFPGETWYQKTVNYNLTVEVQAQPGTITFIAQNLKALFTIRQSDFAGQGKWQIVEWRDDVLSTSVIRTGIGGTSAVEDVTWGNIKHLYHDDESVYLNLSERDDLLHNLALCYNEQNIVEYVRLLDDPNFIYYFSETDFAEGATPELWGRAEDIQRQAKMFDPNYSGEYKVISIDLSLQYPARQWIATIPDQDEFPGETWYYKSVTYNLTLVAEAEPENITFIAQNLRALFTVRQTEFEGAQKWRIVEWRDDMHLATFPVWASASTRESTWGKVKTLYN